MNRTRQELVVFSIQSAVHATMVLSGYMITRHPIGVGVFLTTWVALNILALYRSVNRSGDETT